MKKNFITIIAFILTICLGGVFFHVKAAVFQNVTDNLSETAFTQMTNPVVIGDTDIEVISSQGFTIGDTVFINDGINNEQQIIANITGTTITVGPLTNNYDPSTVTVSVNLLSGITHDFTLETATAGNIEKIIFELDEDSINDGASFAFGSFGFIAGISEAAVPNHVFAPTQIEFDANGGLIPAGNTINFELLNIFNPSGENANVYGINISTLDAGDDVIDNIHVLFSVNPGLIVEGTVPLFLDVNISDDGTVNNPADSLLDPNINLGGAKLDTLSDALNGYGVDGVEFRVTTNARNGYTASIQDNTFGLASPNYAGPGRPNDVDHRINDIAGGPKSWDPPGMESYGFAVDATFDINSTSNNYMAFSDIPFVFKNQNSPIIDDITYITVRSQIDVDTVPGTYSDQIVFTVVPNL